MVARTQAALQSIEQIKPDRVAVLAGDMGDPAVGQQAVELALKRFGKLDGLVINHGMVEPVERICDASIEEWKKSFDINVFSVIALVGPKESEVMCLRLLICVSA